MFQWISRIIEEGGYLAVAALMLLENLVPPIPSEVIMPLAGYVAARGDLNIVLVVIFGSFGSALGSSAWYFIGLKLGDERVRAFIRLHGRWLALDPEGFDSAVKWFEKNGGKAVLFGRLMPTVRTLISLPAGIARMSFAKFASLTLLGTTIWTALLASLGYALGEKHQQVSKWIDPISMGFFATIAIWYIYRMLTFKPGKF